MEFKENILPLLVASWFLLPKSSNSNKSDDKKFGKKSNQSKILHNYSSKRMSQFYSSIQPPLNKVNGRQSEDKCCYSSTKKDNKLTTEETSRNVKSVDEQKITSYADVLAKTEKICSENDFICGNEQLEAPELINVPDKEITLKDSETNPTQEETNVEVNLSSGESSDWESTNSSPKKENKCIPDTSLTEIKSEKEETPADFSGILKDKDSKLLVEKTSFGYVDFFAKSVDDDSAYGSDGSLPTSSPEPTDLEVGPKVLEDVLESDDSDSEIYLDQDSECVCGNPKCNKHQTSEFLKGLSSTRPRRVSHGGKKCQICYNDIVDEYSLINRFGLLLNCEHSFCYHCIFSACYRKPQPDSIFKVRCPVCNAFSPGIVSSARWIKSKIKKDNMFQEMKSVYIEWFFLK